MTECIVPGCGKHLRTGRKYCWRHRSLGRGSTESGGGGAGGLLFFVIIIFILFAFLPHQPKVVEDVKIYNLPIEKDNTENIDTSILKENTFNLEKFCGELFKGYDNQQTAVYFNNKDDAMNQYIRQGYASNTQSYMVSICRIDQIGLEEESIILFRSVWWRSPVVCTINGILKCPKAEDINDKQ